MHGDEAKAGGRGTSLPGRLSGSGRVAALWTVFAVQSLSALVFIGIFWSEVLGLRSFEIEWVYIELVQILASLGLIMGAVTSALYLRRNMEDVRHLRRQVEVASGDFSLHIDQAFSDWNLSKAEVEVACCALKGFSNPEIAEMRGASVATVKSQMTSIYRKSGLRSRQQLTSYLLEDIIAGVALEQNDERPHSAAKQMTCSPSGKTTSGGAVCVPYTEEKHECSRAEPWLFGR